MPVTSCLAVPSSMCSLARRVASPLPSIAGMDDAAVGGEFRVERVQDWDDAALQHLAALGLVPGVTLVVLERAPFGGPLWVRFDGRDHALGEALTRLVHGREIRADVPA